MDSKEVKATVKRMPPAAGKGRKVGTLNKTTAAVKETLMLAFVGVGGLPALVAWGKENPTPFYQTWAKLLPNEIKAEMEIKTDDLTPDERYSRALAILDAARARRAAETVDAAE